MICASGIYNMYLEAPDTLWTVKIEPLMLGLPPSYPSVFSLGYILAFHSVGDLNGEFYSLKNYLTNNGF